jgi:hypothetical protein
LFTSHNGGTVEYNTKETWSELFKKRYPSIYQKLMFQNIVKHFWHSVTDSGFACENTFKNS